jgi:membrane fusion protein (multidrug efflux system)/multidrug efflux system membrane fusion protein/cobalt-zinc-cadmium efflux system membrane fusion protein
MKPNTSRPGAYAAALLLALLLAACSNSQNDAGDQADTIPVEVTSAQRQTVTRSLAYDGDVEAEFEIQVFSRVPDRIERLLVDVGDRVRQGALIARVRATAIEQAVRQAEAALVAARAQEANVRLEYERSQRLFKENALSQQQLDAIRTQFEAVTAQSEQAEAMVKTARSQLNDAQITAPIAGIVATRNYEEGDMATLAQPLFTIVQMDRVKVAFEVAESDIGLLKTGQTAEVRVKSYPERAFKATLAEISPVLDRTTRMARVEVVLDNPGYALKPGMFARVEVRIDSIKDVIVVPRHATIETTSLDSQNGTGVVVKNYSVYVVTGDSVHQRRLGVAYINHEYIAVSSGLSDGERYVTVGQNTLRDGARVVITGGEESDR